MRRHPPLRAAAAAVFVTVLAGCTLPAEGVPVSGTTPNHDIPVTTGSVPGQDVVALPAGGIDDAVDGLPGIVRSVMERTGIPGAAVAVVHDGETVFAEGYGVRKLGEEGAVDPDTVFQIASLSKPVGATVVAREVSQGLVEWTTPVADLLPGFGLEDPWVSSHATVGDFYAHRTGLPPAAGDLLEDIGYGRDYVIDHLRHQPLDPFRASYGYANFGTTVGAEAVATAAGNEWETLSEEQLYRPLGMDSTSSRHADFLGRENRATLHAKVAEGTFEPLHERDADAQSPAGGVSSTVGDLAEWMKLILGSGTYDGRELVAEEDLLPAISAQSIASRPTAPDQRAGQYGFGFGVGVQPGGRVGLSHSGAFSLGAATTVVMLPSAGVGIVVLTNASPVGAPEAVAAAFLDEAQFGHATRDWVETYGNATAGFSDPVGDLAGRTAPADPVPARPLSAYTGEYASEYYGTATVTEEDGALVLAVGPDGVSTAVLEHWDADTFAYAPRGENAPDGSLSSVVFTGGGDTAVSMTVDFFQTASKDLGTWRRAG
ncbi:serine hydrolase [Arthrobacter sp. B0490]|uniref:serine hydrolase n=1 Tax=Arthrobacter sp. B0490 TaxID=2058891 RepID=UPI000CE4164F|nr:serine hydrolase [Arthrobacter sp. B0490]